MDRKTALWCLTVFFGASITFQALKSATEGCSQAESSSPSSRAALAIMIVAVVLIVRARSKPKK